MTTFLWSWLLFTGYLLPLLISRLYWLLTKPWEALSQATCQICYCPLSYIFPLPQIRASILLVPRCRFINKGDRGFAIRVSRLWNEVRAANFSTSFKSLLKKNICLKLLLCDLTLWHHNWFCFICVYNVISFYCSSFVLFSLLLMCSVPLKSTLCSILKKTHYHNYNIFLSPLSSTESNTSG